MVSAAKPATLHLRAIHTLVRAIQTDDGHAPGCLECLEACALELGRRLGLEEADLQALQVASILRDIGTLAVPRHILSKPGQLTPEEFEKMKIHPAVGAEIVERMEFPYPVAPIVRSHHERWDGSGYPDGLRAEAIPIGARILAVADCLAALSADQDLEPLVSGAGAAFDPEVVRVACDMPRAEHPRRQPDFPAAIAAARHEEQMLHELAGDLGNSLSLEETLSALDGRLKRLVRYHAMAVYLVREDRLAPAYANGENSRLFSSLEIPLGQGLSGQVAETRQPIVNGDPSAELKNSALRSTLAVPLENGAELTGVLALYHAEPDAFGKDDLRVLLAIRGKVALAVENALKHQRAERSASVDPLTSLPNARALFLRLDAELARCRRNRGSLAVLVCEVDGLKQVHHRFGQPAGRRLLEAFASGLRRICREEDCVARTGDEFVLVLGGFSRRDLAEKQRHIESLMEELSVADWGERLLAVRLGAAFYPEDGADAEDLLAAADSRLHLARQGRADRFATALAELGAALQNPAVRTSPTEADREELS